MIFNYDRRKYNQSSSSSSSDSSIYAAFVAAARRDAVARGATGAADSGSSMRISSSLLAAAFFAGGFFGGACGFVLPDALRAVVVVLALGAGLAAALDPAGFFSKKSVTEGWVVGFVFLAGLIYASLSSSLSSLLRGQRKESIIGKYHIARKDDDRTASTYDLRLLDWAWAALPLPFSSAARTRSSPESESRSFVVGDAFFCFGGSGSSAISMSEPDSALGGCFFARAAGAAIVRFLGGGGRSSSRLKSSSSSTSSPFLAFGLARDAPPAGATAPGLLRALAAAAFFVGMKSSSPPESSPPPMRLLEPMDFRVLSVACFRLTFLPLESTTDLSSHSWDAFCHRRNHGVSKSVSWGPKGGSVRSVDSPPIPRGSGRGPCSRSGLE